MPFQTAQIGMVALADRAAAHGGEPCRLERQAQRMFVEHEAVAEIAQHVVEHHRFAAIGNLGEVRVGQPGLVSLTERILGLEQAEEAVEIRGRHPDRAAGLEDSRTFGQEALGVAQFQMLDHMLGEDHVGAGIGEGQRPAGVEIDIIVMQRVAVAIQPAVMAIAAAADIDAPGRMHREISGDQPCPARFGAPAPQRAGRIGQRRMQHRIPLDDVFQGHALVDDLIHSNPPLRLSVRPANPGPGCRAGPGRAGCCGYSGRPAGAAP